MVKDSTLTYNKKCDASGRSTHVITSTDNFTPMLTTTATVRYTLHRRMCMQLKMPINSSTRHTLTCRIRRCDSPKLDNPGLPGWLYIQPRNDHMHAEAVTLACAKPNTSKQHPQPPILGPLSQELAMNIDWLNWAVTGPDKHQHQFHRDTLQLHT
jgi:hypothetical protein